MHRFMLLCVLSAFSMAVSATGSLDPTFAEGGKRIMRFDTGADIPDIAASGLMDSKGRYVSVGSTDEDDKPERYSAQLTRHLASGARDLTFAGTGFLRFRHLDGSTMLNAVAEQAGQLIVAGHAKNKDTAKESAVVCRIDEAGVRDQEFGEEGCRVLEFQSRSRAVDVAVLADDSILVLVSLYETEASYAIARLQPDGVIDLAFHPECQCGYVLSPDAIDALMIPVAFSVDGSTGDIAVVGHSTYFGALLLARHTSDGAPDTDFSPFGARFIDFSTAFKATASASYGTRDVASDVEFTNGGATIVVGTAFPFSDDPDLVETGMRVAVAKLLSDGTPDPAFGNTVEDGMSLLKFGAIDSRSNAAAGMAIDVDGAAFIAGRCYLCNGTLNKVALGRLTPSGEWDAPWREAMADERAVVDVIEGALEYPVDRSTVWIDAGKVVVLGNYQVQSEPGLDGMRANPFLLRFERFQLFSDGFDN